MSMPQLQPLTYKVTKIQNTSPKGIMFITVKQDEFNQFTDYVNLEAGEMYADYYKSNVNPDDSTSLTPDESSSDDSLYKIVLNTSSYNIALGFKKPISATVMDGDEEIDYTQTEDKFIWTFLLDGEPIEDISSVFESINTTGDYDENISLTVLDNDDFIDSIITVTCNYSNVEYKSVDLSVGY